MGKHTPGRLYYHKTDGGAEYLCTKPVHRTTEGDLHFAAVRIDGHPELLGAYRTPPAAVLAALKGLCNIATHPKATKAEIAMIAKEARAAIEEAGE